MSDLPLPFPYRWKYLLERELLRPWFIFGVSQDGAHVDLSDGVSDVFVRLPIRVGARICEVREQFLTAMEEINADCRGKGAAET